MFVIALLSKNGRTRMLFKLIRLKNEKKNYIYTNKMKKFITRMLNFK